MYRYFSDRACYWVVVSLFALLFTTASYVWGQPVACTTKCVEGNGFITSAGNPYSYEDPAGGGLQHAFPHPTYGLAPGGSITAAGGYMDKYDCTTWMEICPTGTGLPRVITPTATEGDPVETPRYKCVPAS